MLFRVFVATWLLLAIVACKSDTPTQGGGSGAGGGSGGGGGPTTYSVGGTVSGLWGTIVLQNNGGDNLTLNNNGSFAFATALANGASYNVTVHTQPSGQNCTVSNGSGNISGANVTNVAVSCVNLPYTVGGSVWGLSGTLVLQNNGGDDITLNSDGGFSFPTQVPNSGTYDVTVLTNPSGQVCHVRDNQGTIAGANVTNITVQCAAHSSANWVQDAYLKASNAGTGDWFGSSVAISGSTIVVGANFEDSNQTTITNTDGEPTSAMSNDGAANSGAVYVFKRNTAGDWIQDAYLKASNAESGDVFGRSVAISGSTIVVGAGGESSNQTTITNTDGQPTSAMSNNDAPSAGAVYVFKRDASGNWVQDAYLKASNAEGTDFFGVSVAISGSTIVVGADGEDSNATTINNNDGQPTSAMSNNSASDSGAVYVFKRDANGNWIQDAYLKASNAETNDSFGSSVAISGSTIVVGAEGEDSNVTTINNNDGEPTSATSNNSASDSGAVYVFKRDASGNWVQDAYLKASNAETNDSFGSSVAISGSTIVVGAVWEDSNVTTINNNDGEPTSAMSNNSASNAGAVYVFKRDTSGNWVQDAYLKASNAEGNDFFGSSVAISGSTIVVGAEREDSNVTTINNNDGQPTSAMSNNGASDSGAVYVFKRDASGNWIQDAYLKASNTGSDDRFGWSVAISGSTIVVGAISEDSDQTFITNNDNQPTSAMSNEGATDSGAVYVFKAF